MESSKEEGGARNCQQKLADTLVGKLGLEGAIQACRENQWEGVLACVLEMKREEETGIESPAPRGDVHPNS